MTRTARDQKIQVSKYQKVVVILPLLIINEWMNELCYSEKQVVVVVVVVVKLTNTQTQSTGSYANR